MLHGIVKTGTITAIGLLGINSVAAGGLTLAAAGSTAAAGLPIIALYVGYRILSGTVRMAGTFGNGLLIGLGAYVGQRIGRALSRGLNQTERAAAADRIAQRSGLRPPQPRQAAQGPAAAGQASTPSLAAFRAPTAAQPAPETQAAPGTPPPRIARTPDPASEALRAPAGAQSPAAPASPSAGTRSASVSPVYRNAMARIVASADRQ